MSFFAGFLLFLFIVGVGAAMVTNYLGLYQLPGQCKSMCPECQSNEPKPTPEPTPTPKPKTTTVSYPWF